MKRESRAPLIIAIVLLLLPVLYVGSYLALVKPGYQTFQHGTGHSSSDSDETVIHSEAEYIDTTYPTYRLQSEWIGRIFWPLQQIDRKVRPDAWGPKTLRGPERQVVRN